VKKLLSPAVRFAIEDCVDLPPTTTQTREVALSAEQDKAMKDLKKNLQLQLSQGVISAANEAVLRLKLIQIACGAVYDSSHVAHYLDATPRLNELLEVIEESARKTIIFAPLTSVVELLHTKLTKMTKHKVSLIHGGVTSNARAQIFQDFQDGGAGSAHLLVADAGTMSHGLTLTAATTICWYGPSERTEVYLQANKRIARPGQQFPTTIVQLASTPTEREIYKRLANNENMQGVMLKLAEE
jgi:SNF2 family DNA or RNA helicase